MNIPTLKETARGCGFRKPGGLYFRAEGRGRSCGLLPIPLERCPTCGGGIKFSRGWTWIDVAALGARATQECKLERDDACGDCPLADAKIQKAGLLWIGEKFYNATTDFLKEADRMGISRRIHSIPRNFKLGETWIALAHIHAIPPAELKLGEGKATAGIFQLFKPTAIEYVIKGDETEEELEVMTARGITPVEVEPIK